MTPAGCTQPGCGGTIEDGYCRALASLTPDPARKVELVDMANDIRPRTWT
jgi:hypothetical protein